MEPIAFRLSEQMAAKLDHLIQEGKFKDRSEAIRAGLALLDYVDSQEHEGRTVVSVPKGELKRFAVARPVPA